MAMRKALFIIAVLLVFSQANAAEPLPFDNHESRVKAVNRVLAAYRQSGMHGTKMLVSKCYIESQRHDLLHCINMDWAASYVNGNLSQEKISYFSKDEALTRISLYFVVLLDSHQRLDEFAEVFNRSASGIVDIF